MDFTFSEDQDALRDAVRAFLDDWSARSDARGGLAPDDWRAVVELGWTGVLVDERHGGLGLGLVDAVVVLEEMGRVAFPGPYLSSLVAADAARRLRLDDLAAAVAEGQVGAVALEELGHGDPVARVRTRARRSGARWTLTGEKAFVLDETPAVPVGPPGDHTAVWRAVADDTAVALAAELTGVCDAAIAMAMGYAEQRVQFDQPIASHQVIQHKLVDMLHATELGRVGVHYAAWASDTDDPDAARAASIAKAQMGDAAVMVTGENIQVHGAVGFTWDSRAGVLYQRAKLNDVLGGGRSWHRRRVADLVLDAS